MSNSVQTPNPNPVSPSGAAPATPAAAPVSASSRWLRLLTPLLVAILAVAIVVTTTRNWNAWEGGHAEQVTDDASVRGDVTPLSTKVAGIVRDVKVADYQQVHRGDLLVELEDDDFKAQEAQARAAVEAAVAAINNNQSQRELQDARIQLALLGIEQAKAQIAAAQAGEEAVAADVVRTQSERQRQAGLILAHATTQQQLESAVADADRFKAQFASREADLAQAHAHLESSEQEVETERRAKTVIESQGSELVADLHVRQAALVAARVNLAYTKIYAPADGTVGERQVHPGQLVSPGTQVIPFVDRTKWVQANYRETQLTNVKVGDPVEIRIDELPGKLIDGKVAEIAPASGSQFALLPPDNATGNYTKVVQRVPVKIAIDDAQFASTLRPGLSAVVTVRTKR